jgi:hypothetical protein
VVRIWEHDEVKRAVQLVLEAVARKP